MKLIDKDALVAEIQRRIKEYQSTGDDYWFPVIENLKSILSFLNTHEVKEVDIEREMQAFAKINLEPLVISDSNIGISITMSQLYDCAKHFFELGIQVSNKAQKGE